MGFWDDFLLDHSIANLFGLKGLSRDLFFASQKASPKSKKETLKTGAPVKKETPGYVISYVIGEAREALSKAADYPYAMFRFQQLDNLGNPLGKAGQVPFPEEKIGDVQIRFTVGGEQRALRTANKYPEYGIEFVLVNKKEFDEADEVRFL